MADYSQFDPGLQRWLKQVWERRLKIKKNVMKWSDLMDAAFGRKSGANKVYDIYNSSEKVEVGDDLWEIFQCKLEILERRHGIKYTPYPKFCKDAWFHFVGKSPKTPVLWRIYLRFVDPLTTWGHVAQYCLKSMAASNNIVEFKVAGPGLSKERSDHMVIMMKDVKSMDNILDVLRTDPRMSGLFAGSVPAGAKQVAPGVGWAAQPLSLDGSAEMAKLWKDESLSFGSYLSGVIYMALEQSWDKNEDHYAKELLEFFHSLGIDPKRPHLLRLIPEAQLQMMVNNAQVKIVQGKLAPQPTSGVIIDQTHPLPILAKL
jgi:hypothetical protein